MDIAMMRGSSSALKICRLFHSPIQSFPRLSLETLLYEADEHCRTRLLSGLSARPSLCNSARYQFVQENAVVTTHVFEALVDVHATTIMPSTGTSPYTLPQSYESSRLMCEA